VLLLLCFYSSVTLFGPFSVITLRCVAHFRKTFSGPPFKRRKSAESRRIFFRLIFTLPFSAHFGDFSEKRESARRRLWNNQIMKEIQEYQKTGFAGIRTRGLKKVTLSGFEPATFSVKFDRFTTFQEGIFISLKLSFELSGAFGISKNWVCRDSNPRTQKSDIAGIRTRYLQCKIRPLSHFSGRNFY